MPRAVEIINGRCTNPSTTFTGLTMDTGDSATVRNMASGMGYMHQTWAQGATAGIVRVRSPRMHDNLQGIRVGYIAASPRPLWPDEVSTNVFSQDTLLLDMTGGAAEIDAAAFLMDYDDVGGVAARLASWAEIKPRVVNIMAVQTQHTTSATGAQYGGEVAINSFQDTFKANIDYALLGYKIDVAALSVGWRGPDTGNFRVGGPGTIDEWETRTWFIRLGALTGRPMIPVFNSANKFGTLVDLVATATSSTRNVFSIYAQLAEHDAVPRGPAVRRPRR